MLGFPLSTSATLRASVLALGLVLPAWAWGIEQMAFIPTRFQLCSQELAELEVGERDKELRQCLATRYQHERAMRNKCAQLIKRLKPAPRNADERYRARRQCFIDHLTASYHDLEPAALPAANPRPRYSPTAAQAATAKLLPPTATAAPVAVPAASNPAEAPSGE